MYVTFVSILVFNFMQPGLPANNGAQAPLPRPKLDVAFMPDPRHQGVGAPGNVSIVGFYFPSHAIKVDVACGAPFVGNFWTPAPIEDFAPPDHVHDPHTFNCSEACFWASQWWDHASDFEGLDGQHAFDLAMTLISRGVPADPNYGGFGNAWKLMWMILRRKFTRGSMLAAGLLATRDAYLVEHQEGRDSDNQWSDYCDGVGSNWLGLQLMVLRDELRVASDSGGTVQINSKDDISVGIVPTLSWSAFAAASYNLDNGVPLAGEQTWQAAVQRAAVALNVALPYQCPPKAIHGALLEV